MSRTSVQSALSIASKPGKYGGIKKSSVKDMGFMTDYLTALGQLNNATKTAFGNERKTTMQDNQRAENLLALNQLGVQRSVQEAQGGGLGGRSGGAAAAIQAGNANFMAMNDTVAQALQKLQGLGAEQRAAMAANAVTAQGTVDSNLKAAYDATNDKYLSDRTLQGSALTAAAGLEGQKYAADKAYAAANLGSGGGNPGQDQINALLAEIAALKKQQNTGPSPVTGTVVGGRGGGVNHRMTR